MTEPHGWQADPSGRHEYRYFSEGRLTHWVSDHGRVVEDPMDPAPEVEPPSYFDPALRIVDGLAPTEAASLPPVRDAGWYRNTSNPDLIKYWNGLGWADDEFPGFLEPTIDPSTGPGPTSPAASTAPLTPAGWYPDPTEHSQLRWWDGERWTEDLQPRTSS